MCHGAAIAAFPEPQQGERIDGEIVAYAYGSDEAEKRIAVIPDIYGAGPFYRGLSQRFADKGARVFLTDPFDGLGELPEATREHAFARRHKVRDRDFLDRLERFGVEHGVTGILGFCLGGLYVFELARREVDMDLVGLYGFPQGLPNDDGLPVPFDYLPTVKKHHVMLMGHDDASVGPENIDRLAQIAKANQAIDLTVYEDVGHNFLPLLDSENEAERAIAEDALRRCDAALL